MHQLIETVSRVLAEHFLVVWATLLFAVAGALTAATPLARSAAAAAPPEPATRSVRLAVLCFSAFVALYSAWILWEVDFAGLDASLLTCCSVRGVDYPPPIWRSEGRFFPLGLQEFNLLRHWSRSALGYHGFAVAEMVVTLLALDRVLEDAGLSWRLTVLTVLLLSPGWFTAFSGLVFPERNLLFVLPVLLLAIRRFERTGSRAWLIAGLTAGQLALYLKEPMFLLIGALSGCRLLLRWRQSDRSRGTIAFLRANPLETGLVILALGFVGFYGAVMLPYRSLGYAQAHARADSAGGVLLTYLRTDWILTLFLVALLVRGVRLSRHTQRLDPFWDPLALSAVVYSLVYPFLRLLTNYYLAPAHLLMVPYLAWLVQSAAPAGIRRQAGVMTTAVVVAIHGSAGVVFQAVQNKNVVRAWSGLAGAIKAEVRRGGEREIRLFFPAARPYWIMEFAAFLEYKGLAVDGPGIRLEAPRQFPNGRCVDYRPVACHSSDSAASGTLEVALPNDDPSPTVIARLADEAAVLYQYQPILVPGWSLPLYSAMRCLGSTGTAPAHLPADWLQGLLLSKR